MKHTEKKKLYATLWVDDWTSFPLSEKDVRWFHDNAGPLSLGLEMDERLPRPFNLQFRQLREQRTDPSADYLGHHYHPVRWKGPSLVKRTYDSLRLRRFAYLLVRLMRIEKWAQTVRMALKHKTAASTRRGLVTVAILLVVAASFFLYRLDWRVLVGFLTFTAVIASCAGLILAAHLPKNWEYLFSDWNYNRTYFNELNQQLREHGLRYSTVVRHGWSLPPLSSMSFYLTEMGVLADASASPTPRDAKAGKGSRQLTWKYTEPYYASLSGDYDVSWNGNDEADRGILEIPINLGNVAEHGLDIFAKDRIAQTAPGGLVSTYMHGWDDFTPIKDWVTYLKQNYDVTFVRADWYAQLFMKTNPRPVVVSRELKAYWALKQDGAWHSIAEADPDIVAAKVISNDGHASEIVLTVNTDNPIPEIGIDSTLVIVNRELPLEQDGGKTVLRNVNKGTYHLKLGNSLEMAQL